MGRVSFFGMDLVIELEGVVGIREVLLGLFFDAIVGGNPVQKLCYFFLIGGPGSLVSVKGLDKRRSTFRQ